MKFKILKVMPLILLISLNACSDKESTWAPRAKYLVETQCGLFTKVRIFTNKYTKEEIELLQYFKEHREINIKSYTEKEKETLRCCTTNIINRYTQDEYMAKSSVKLELQIALDSCK